MRWLLILLTITIASCWRDNNNCPDKHSYNFGEILLQDSAKQFILPYLKYKKVFFKDSLNNEVGYEIDTSYKKTIYNTARQYSTNCPGYANYSSIIDQYTAYLIKNGSRISGIYLESVPYFYEDKYDYNQKIYVPIDGYLYYFSISFENKLQLNTSNNPEITLTANGKTYKNVIVPNAKTYFHRQYGLLAFRDSSGTLWVFDRFE